MRRVDSNALCEAKVEGRSLVHGALRWRVVVLPGADTLPIRAWQNLERFRNAGGIVIAVGSLPANSSTRFPDPEVIGLGRAMFAAADRLVPFGAEARLTSLIDTFVPNDVNVTDPAAPIRYTRRRIGGRDVYFIINDSPNPWTGEVRLSARGPGEILDPRSGKLVPASANGVLTLTFGPYDSLIIRYRPDNSSG